MAMAVAALWRLIGIWCCGGWSSVALAAALASDENTPERIISRRRATRRSWQSHRTINGRIHRWIAQGEGMAPSPLPHWGSPMRNAGETNHNPCNITAPTKGRP